MFTHHPNCTHNGCIINREQCQILAGSLFGPIHEIVCFFLLNYEYTGTFFDTLRITSGLNTQDLSFALADLKTVGIVVQDGHNTFNSLWKVAESVDISHLCDSNESCVIELYKRLGNSKKGTRCRQKRRIDTSLSKINNRWNTTMKRRRNK